MVYFVAQILIVINAHLVALVQPVTRCLRNPFLEDVVKLVPSQAAMSVIVQIEQNAQDVEQDII